MSDERRVTELLITGNLAGQFVQNVLHLDTIVDSAADPYSYAEELVDNLNDTHLFFENWTAGLPDSYLLLSLRYRQIYPTPAATLIRVATSLSNQQGQRTGAISAQQNCPMIKMVSFVDAAHPGRIFMCGISEEDVNDGIIDPGLVTAYAPLLANLRATINGTTPTSVSRFIVLKKGALALDRHVEFAQIMPSVYSQRRRMSPRA
jgi:hypothetical protein